MFEFLILVGFLLMVVSPCVFANLSSRTRDPERAAKEEVIVFD